MAIRDVVEGDSLIKKLLEEAELQYQKLDNIFSEKGRDEFYCLGALEFQLGVKIK